MATLCLLTHFASNICIYLNISPKADWHILMNLLFPFRERDIERSHNNKLFLAEIQNQDVPYDFPIRTLTTVTVTVGDNCACSLKILFLLCRQIRYLLYETLRVNPIECLPLHPIQNYITLSRAWQTVA